LDFAAVNTSKGFYMDKALPPVLSALIGSKLRKKFYAFSDKTTDEVLRAITKNETLIKVLSAQYGDYGLPQNKVVL
jgi:all-trans-retinol 13,14-reductase